MQTQQSTAVQKADKSDFVVGLGISAVILFFIITGFISYSNIRTLVDGADDIAQTHVTLSAFSDLKVLMVDAETGQRGYILTGEREYLEPYERSVAAINSSLDEIEKLTANNARLSVRIPALRTHVEAKVNEMQRVIDSYRNGGVDAAKIIITSGRGKAEMDAIRNVIFQLSQIETEVRAERKEIMADAHQQALFSGILAAALGVGLALIVGRLVTRAATMRKRQQWLQSGQVGLSKAMFGDQTIAQLGENIIKFLSEYCRAHVGVLYAAEGSGFVRAASYGVPADSTLPDRFMPGDGLLGQAAKDRTGFIVNDIPDGYLSFGSALGHAKPRHLVVSSAASDGVVNAVFELGFVNDMPENVTELLDSVSETISISVRAAHYRAHLQNLLEETQRQAEELQAQSEELRVSNEELEEQSRALKESQTRLEQQQAELEQTNAQLEEQTQILEVQKQDIETSRREVQAQATELARASQYKSDFLANMSHELRTPLNSSIILAKLLADNPQENLTEEQVKFAQTIQSSGNDLLALINDILDLSKIEAGHMDIRPETVVVSRVSSDLERLFRPLADQKGLSISVAMAEGCPSAIETDRQRLEQVLKNLLSNAIKFTDKGSVTLGVACKDDMIAFTVKDTGIGISAEQQKAIFDAFRQADGTISRKYGGTGLGLSISRELARLLGGHITVESKPRQGSTFTLTIPVMYDEANVEPLAHHDPAFLTADFETAPLMQPEPAPASVPKPKTRRQTIVADDREVLRNGSRVILIVEDDNVFAEVLRDLAHELEFQCLIASTAEDALILTKQYVPSAVILDIGLPDNSGLSVLDRIKRDPRLRHIPVHVVSGNDYAQTALSLGAVGYMLKPVKREELVDALETMEARFSQRMRRVLIVEDDDVQRESIYRLLGSHDVDTTAVATASECLKQLNENTFDCMVLDLTLPDATGYSILETLNSEDRYSFPPVIVYTGRDLSADEEQRLRKYSKSIIIKGAKSPERLLDEVTLFLHQVVSELPPEQQKMLEKARNRDSVMEDRHILVVEDDIRNVYALTNILEPRGARVHIARNGREAIEMLAASIKPGAANPIDLVLMDVMMPEVDGITATREIRKNKDFRKLPIIMLTAKAMKDDQERCLDAGANDYMAKPLDVEKLLSLVRVWMPR